MFDESRESSDDEFRHIAVLFAVLELFQQQEGSIEEEFALHHGRDDLVRFLKQPGRGSTVRQDLEGSKQLLSNLLGGVLSIDGIFIVLDLFNHGAVNIAWKVL